MKSFASEIYVRACLRAQCLFNGYYSFLICIIFKYRSCAYTLSARDA